jgi:hypothetical protein
MSVNPWLPSHTTVFLFACFLNISISRELDAAVAAFDLGGGLHPAKVVILCRQDLIVASISVNLAVGMPDEKKR